MGTDLVHAGEWERSRVGDRLAAFSVLLPPAPAGPVVVALERSIWPFLTGRYPDLCVLARAPMAVAPGDGPARVVTWDGAHSPLAPGSVALLIVDARTATVDALRPALAPDGVLAMLGRTGEYVIYPSAERPEQVWRRGWPMPARPGLVAQLRRSTGLRGSRWRRIPRLSIAGAPFTSLADLVLADLVTQTGVEARIVGIETAGQTILRVRRPDGDLAVRLCLSGVGPVRHEEQKVAADVVGVRHLVLAELAHGETAGCPWIATTWLPRRRRLHELWGAERRRWRVAEELASALQATSTGRTGPGWAQRWCADIATLPEQVRARLARVLAPLEDGVATGWCHGDLWPANIVLDRGAAGVIDWENAVPDAPLGLDWLLIEGLRTAARGGTMAEACVGLIDGSRPITNEVGGRRFAEWDDERRVALVVAAYVHYLRNRSLHNLGIERLIAELDMLFAALAAPCEAASSPPGNAGRAARGAVWLGLSAVVVKGSQTVVLLVVAALLAPSALGLLSLGALVTNVAQTLSDMGTATGLVYWRRDPARAARSALALSVVTSLLIAATVWVIAPWLGHALRAGPDATWVIRGLVSVLPCYGIAAVSQELLRRELAFVRRIVPDVVAALAGAVVAIVMALNGHGLAGVVVGQVVQGVLAMVLTWAVGRVVWPAWNAADVRALLRYGGHLTVASVLGLVLLNVDYILVARVLGSTALGQYSLAFRLAYLPYLNIGFVIAGAAFPYLCRLEAGAVGRAVERVVTAAMTLLVPVCLGLALFADQLELLGRQWSPAVPAVRWLALYAALLTVAQFMYTALDSVGSPRATMLLRLLHLIALVVVLTLLVRYGVQAVAVGQVLAAGLAAAAALLFARRRVGGLRLRRLVPALLPMCAGGACMAIVAISIQHAVPASRVSAAGLVALGSLAVAAYLVPVMLLGRADLAHTVRTIGRRA